MVYSIYVEGVYVNQAEGNRLNYPVVFRYWTVMR